MKRKLTAVLITSAFLALSACGSDDDDGGAGTEQTGGGAGDGDGIGDGDGDGDGDGAGGLAGSFQVTFTNLTGNQLMTPPVVALHDPSVHLFQVGETSSDAIRDIAEMGDNAPLVEFAGANPEVVSAAGVAGEGPFSPGGSVTINLSTDLDGQVLSAVNMVICTNDGIVGVDSIALPADNEPVTVMAVAYDAGTRDNSADPESFFPPPCRAGDAVPPAETSPRAPIALHPGQTVPNSGGTGPLGNADWNLTSGQQILSIEVVRN